MTTAPDNAHQDVVAASATRIVLFRVGLAITSLYHLAAHQPADRTTPMVASWLICGLLALVTLAKPRLEWPALVLSVLILITAWIEAPTIGNHWLLVAFFAMVLLFSSIIEDLGKREQVLASTGRLVLLGAYAFAAFAKLNSSFFNPIVSCAVVYSNQLTSSWGQDWLSIDPAQHQQVGLAVAIATAATELTIPILLIIRRTRRYGVLLAMAFHWLLALDLDQHFWDFTSALYIGFLLFASTTQLSAWLALLTKVRDALPVLVQRAIQVLIGAAGVLVLYTVATDKAIEQSVWAGHLSWMIFGTTALVCMAIATWRTRTERAQKLAFKPAHLVMALLPALVVFNGLTPYLNIKTGFSWNMYSNLRTGPSESNHLLVPRVLDLTGSQKDLVTIQSTDDPTLAYVKDNNFAMVYSEFRRYAQDNPTSVASYTYQGRSYYNVPLGSSPAAQESVGVLVRHLQSFRLVSLAEDQTCRLDFSAAR